METALLANLLPSVGAPADALNPPVETAPTAPEIALTNAVTVDVEDWAQAVLDPGLPLSDRFVANTQRVLECFARHGVRGTFFVLGLAAERSPELVREIHAAGHEVQSHGHGHELLFRLDARRFRADVERSKKLLEDIIGERVFGYRAPAFSIARRTLWALDVLVEAGFEVDSSIFPLRMPRYGIDGAPTYPHRLKTPGGAELSEVPVASLSLMGRRIPVGGGGYFRLFPTWLLRRGIQYANHSGRPATIYMHPHEFASDELMFAPRELSWQRRMHQSLGRRGFAGKVERLLSEFRFGRVRDLLASCGELPTHAGHAPECGHSGG